MSACGSASFFVANLPLINSDAEIFKDIKYGDKDWQVLDIYKPSDIKNNAPVLVFFYGGRWSIGSKNQYAFVADRFTKHGYIVAIPDYAKYPDVKFPTFVEDGAKAVAWIDDNIADYGGNKNRIFASGHSSGAHIAALISVDPKYLEKENKKRSVIRAFAGLAGPYDFIPQAEDLKDIFGPPDNYHNMQVPTFVDGAQPPMLLLHGEDDTHVILRNLNRLKSKIEDKGGIVETKIYDDIDHKEIIGALSWVWKDKAPVLEDMLKFFKGYQ